MDEIVVRGAREHNLCNLDLRLPRNSLIVVTGLSGSGKSSLAFDTLYAEGQRRYIELLSTYARQFLEQMEKPDVDSIEGLSPSVSIEQKTTTRSSRSTVGTITEIYDYLRLLFASIGHPHCPRCFKPISRQSVREIVDRVLRLPDRSRIQVLAPVVRQRKGEFRRLFEKFLKEGYLKVRVDGEFYDLESVPLLDKRKNHSVDVVVDRIILSESAGKRMEESVRQALKLANSLVLISIKGGDEFLFSERSACIDCDIDVPILEPRSFSFNSRFGACPACQGLGSKLLVNFDRLVLEQNLSARETQLALGSRDLKYLFEEAACALLNHFGCDENTVFRDYPPAVVNALGEGLAEKIQFKYGGTVYETRFDGIGKWFRSRIENSKSTKRRQQLLSFMKEADCPICEGSRLRPESRAVRVNGKRISDYCRMPLEKCAKGLSSIDLGRRERMIAGPLLEEIQHRLKFLLDVGLDYLTMDRKAVTLSAGEAQRVRLATQVGSQLRGVLYVLDEPSIGLHARDTRNLLSALRSLRDLGNTVIVVEHDEETIRSADHIVDLGPLAGIHGGRIVAQGGLEVIQAEPSSLTGAYLKGTRRIIAPEKRAFNGKQLTLTGVSHNNLKELTVSFPLGALISVTGVSGAGKSSLIDEVLYRALARHLYNSLLEPGSYDQLEGIEDLDKVIEIDQSPIGRSPRSNPATYCGVFTPIRELFAQLPESRIRGYKPGRFSFNVKGGRCDNCSGDGMRKIEMNFLPDVYVLCEACRGQRYNRETLSVKFKGHSIADILSMPVEQAYTLLESIPPIESRLRTLLNVGLGYLTLGQSSTTLSGGEAQRVKLARELSRRSTGKTLYILDEPTTGLHFEDVRKLLDILHELVNLGNTVIVIEHNLDIIRCSDWIIDLGPEGGENGGELVALGTPEKVAENSLSHTGRELAALLGNSSNGNRSVEDDKIQ